MRVKRLEVHGFKSFKDKTIIHFDKKVTGIVGPNGCGKSNIVDAFFWVMGEQSYKHMRGKGSDDLIFNGSSKYNPLGMAEATLVLETAAIEPSEAPAGATVKDLPITVKSKEIAVTRRVYRGGEGEYFINAVPARLKDIHELFMDTGVGTKGYSVIEQGQIGKIVNAKPEDRRILVEEAAGIAKYKARKKESLRKIASAESNLERIHDVLKEIQRNLNSLERQAQKAKRYREYKNELFEKEITWGKKKLALTQKQIDELKGEKEKLEQEVVQFRSEIQRTENQIEVDRSDQLENTKKAEELQEIIEQKTRLLTREESALELSHKRQEDLENQLKSYSDEKALAVEAIAQEESEIASLEQLRNQGAQALEQKQGELATLEAKVNEQRKEVNQTRSALDETRKKLIHRNEEETELRSRVAGIDAKMEAIEAQVHKLESIVSSTQTDLNSIQGSTDELKSDVEKLKQTEDDAAQWLEKAQASLNEEKEKLKTSEQKKQEVTELCTQIESKLSSLKELDSLREGLSSGPKTILKWAEEKGLAHQFGALTDLVEIQIGYEKAFEVWLGENLQSLYCSHTTSASSALDFLKQSNEGKASIFLPSGEQDRVEVHSVKEKIEASGANVLGTLDQFVTVRSNQGELKHLLSQVVLVEALSETQIESILSFARKSRVSVVTKNGLGLSDQGILRGGASESDRDSSLLGRKRAIQELSQELDQILTTKKAILEDHENLRQSIDQLSGDIEIKEDRLQELRIELTKKQGEFERQSRYHEDLQKRLSTSQSEQKELMDDREKLEIEKTEIQSRLSSFDQLKSQLENEVQSKSSVLGGEEAELEEKEVAFSQARIEVASLRERVQGQEKEIGAIRRQLENRQKRLKEVESFLEVANAQKQEHFGGDSEIQGRIESLNREIQDRKASLSEIKDRLERSGSEINSALDQMKSVRDELDQKSNRINEVAVEIEKVQANLNHIVQNLEEKYGPGCLEKNQVPSQEEFEEPVVTEEMSVEEEKALHEDIEALREKIRRIGEVNTMAIEEYEELKKRFDHIDQERSDLENSIENLQKAIEHINQTSKTRFEKAFEAISDRFKHLFPIIFGGGRAELTLVYSEGVTDILESGVEILAQPPGKKIVNIGLLSGGEKALTAVSLIFAIFMVKPSPFCILDEVDAPLDDANIGRFNALLKEMSAKTQFILITHNKKTMELNDTLYGVTMEEPGVSKMISIELQ